MGVVDFKSRLSGINKQLDDQANRKLANERKQAQLDAQKSVNAKRKAEQERAKLQEQNRVALARIDRATQTSFLSELKKSKVPNREIGFFKPTAQLDVGKTKTPLNAFVPDAIPKNVFFDSSGAFNPIDTNVQKYVQTRADKSGQNTPIQIQHNNPPPRISRFPLSSYYSQLNTDGPLGIKGPPNSTGPINLGFKQPFVVRDIGNNWGVDKFTGSLGDIKGVNLKSVGQILQVGFNFLDELGGAVIGRQPSVYISRAGADLFRMGMFLASAKGLGFLTKQSVLKRTNEHAGVGAGRNNKFKGSIFGPISGIYDPLLPGASSLMDAGENLKKYDPTSLMSQPGIGSLQLNINKKLDSEQTFRYLRTLNSASTMDILPSSVPDEIAKKFIDTKPRRYNIKLDSQLDLPSPNLLVKINPVADAISKVAGAGVRFLSSKIPKINLGLNRGKALNFPPVNNPLKGIGKGFGEGIGNLVADVTSGVSSLGRTIGNVVRGIGDGLPSIEFEKIPKNPDNNISKEEALKLRLQGFSEKGQDRVNLIPYGPREKAKYNGETEDVLDFVPFRFVDMDGNHIVFRAILSGISDTFTPDYAEEKYIGRPDKVFVYTGTTRTISFTFDVYPKSAEELPILWDKLNYLAGLTYPDMRSGFMVAPFTKLTIGEMYTEMPGYISALTYTVQDNGTWETMWTKSPKYIQANATFIPIMDRLPAKDQALYDYPWLQRKRNYDKDQKPTDYIAPTLAGVVAGAESKFGPIDLVDSFGEEKATEVKKDLLGLAGI